MHYVVGDLHGCFFEFIKLVHKIQREDKNAKFILIGDVIDRGADTGKILLWCMKNSGENKSFELLLGNHELLFLDWCVNEWFPFCEGKKADYEHAPYQTDIDLSKDGLLTADKIKEIYEFLRQLPLVLEKNILSPKGIQKYVIAHAWAKKEEMNAIRNGVCTAKEYWKTFLLDRTGALENASYDPDGDEILIHGHTPTTDEQMLIQGFIPGRIAYKKHAINIDCGICYGKVQNELPVNLAAICLENLKEYYAYSLEEWFHIKQKGLSISQKSMERAEFFTVDRKSEPIKQAIISYKNQYHFHRPNEMRIKMIRQINGDK